MRVLVTGGTGFLGGRCLQALASSGRFDASATGRRLSSAPAGFDFIAADLSEPGALARLPAVDAVVHTAALSSPWGRAQDFDQANVVATRNLLEWAEQAGVQRLIHISTPALYFAPFDRFDVGEEEVLPGKPINDYARTKTQAENLVLQSPLSTAILRPRAIYGPGDTALLPRLEAALRRGWLPLMRDGQAVTNLTHVDDVCDAIVAALESSAQGVFNIAGGEAIPLNWLVNEIARANSLAFRWQPVPLPIAMLAARGTEAVFTGLRLPSEPRLTRYSLGIFAYSLTLNTKRAQEVLGWRPRILIADGFEAIFGVRPEALPTHRRADDGKEQAS